MSNSDDRNCYGPLWTEFIHTNTRFNHYQTECISGTEFCNDGCWFVLSEEGCKHSVDCNHCHARECCILADFRRRESRKVHSRFRPSKKKRMQINKANDPVSEEISQSSVDVLALDELGELLNSIISNIENSNTPPNTIPNVE